MTTTTRADESTETVSPNDPRSNVIRDGLVGGAVAILLAFLPLSTVFGGGIAGYLQAKRNAARPGRAGALAGGIAFVPHVLVGTYLIMAPAFTPPGPDVGLPVEYLLVGLVGFGVIYAVGLGILGGLLGAYVRTDHVGT